MRTWATVNDLPNELLLTIITLLPLKSLIAVQGVCRHWRTLVHEAHIPPARRQLLDVFRTVVGSPAAHTRPRVPVHYCESDRDEYLRFLARNTKAPQDFVLWVREWPAWGVFGWLWPDTDETRRPVAGPERDRLLVACARAGVVPDWGFGATGWTEPVHVTKPHVKVLTFSGGKTPFAPGAALHATRLLPVEFADIGIQSTTVGMTEVEEDEPSIDIIVLCFGGGNRALILDGGRGGEELKGVVYKLNEGYVLRTSSVLARTWTEYLGNYLLVPHALTSARKFVAHVRHVPFCTKPSC